METADLLPPIPMPPHDPTFWLLNAAVGWRAAEWDSLETLAGPPALSLGRANPRTLTEPGGTFGGLRLPANAACSPGGDLYLLDTPNGLLKRFDPCTCAFIVVP